MHKIKLKLDEIETNSIQKLGILTGVSHELKNFFNGILGPIEILEDNTYEDQYKELLKIIKYNTQNALLMVDDIITFNQLTNQSTNQIYSYKNIINLFDYFENEVKILLKGIPFNDQNDIKIINNSEYIDYVCNIEIIRINQIINNLVSNSIKYSSKNSIITITWNIYNNINNLMSNLKEKQQKYQYFKDFCTIKPDLPLETSILSISVSDNGIGIPENFLSKLFNPFTKANNHNIKESLGLGLSIIKGVILLLKGNIYCMTGKETGTNFTVCFPINLEKKKDNSLNNKNIFLIDDIKKKNVFLIDDSIINLKVLEIFLQKETNNEITISTFLNAESALQMLKDYEYDKKIVNLIITDVHMDGLSGIDLLKEVRGNKYYDKTPIVLCTGSTSYCNVPKELNSLFLMKPVSKKSICEIIKKTLS
jgi:signal transduction histidine kinase